MTSGDPYSNVGRSMENAIREAIEKHARKLIERDRQKKFTNLKYRKKYALRTGENAVQRPHNHPGLWGVSPHFDPAYCIKHSRYISRVIWQKITDRNYQVSPAVLFKVPKGGGEYREVMAFSIPDAAVANLFNWRLRKRNKNIQSPFCYSYRQDRNLFDAVLYTSSLLKGDKVYVVQYDFSNYFDSIKHDYINFVLDESEFFISPAERHVISAFLNHRYSLFKDYSKNNHSRRMRGVPQGSSISLFLSNIAAHELDKELGKSNGSFVRFADDAVCVTSNYSDALNIASIFREHCYYSGISINHKKSPGICLLENPLEKARRKFFIDGSDGGKISHLKHFDYIGHKFSWQSIGISDRAVERIKQRISRIIYIHMLHNLSRNKFSAKRVGIDFYDWDLVTCLNEIRNYIYGGLQEHRLANFLYNGQRIGRLRGLMSFYPLVSNVQQFSALDGWLLSAVRRAHRERKRRLNAISIPLRSLAPKELISGDWYNFDAIAHETNMPSFVLAWRAARKAFRQYGLDDFEKPKYYSDLVSGLIKYD